MKVLAPAKVNFTLEVFGKRPDGYHALRSVVVPISLADELEIELANDGSLSSDAGYDDDLCLKAARLLKSQVASLAGGMGARIHVTKRIPVGGGLGGGSADAAAVLRALNELWRLDLTRGELAELGAQVGSDVPFCVMGGTAIVEGRGELLTKLPPAPEFFLVICKPDFSVSTPELYRKLDETFIEKRPDHKSMQLNLQKGELLGIGGSLCNVFEPIVMQEHFDINYIRSMMYTYGAYGAQMTGSGSAVFGIYDSFEYATVACTMLKDKYSEIFLAKTV